MLVSDITQQSLEAALQGSSARSRALANNVANANTPGYKRIDVDFHSQLTAAIDRAKQAGPNAAVSPSFVARPDQAAAVQPDGNSVDADQENSLVAQNALEYQGYTQLIGLRRRMMEQAMRLSG